MRDDDFTPGPVPRAINEGNTSAMLSPAILHSFPTAAPMHQTKETSFLEGWKFFLALGALVSVPITVAVWLMSYHEKRPHDGSVTSEQYQEFRSEMKDDIKEIKRFQQESTLEMAKQSRAIIEFVNLQEKRGMRR